MFEALEPQRDAWWLLFDTSAPRPARSSQRRRATGPASARSPRGPERFLRARGIPDELDASALTEVWMGVVNSLVLWWLAHPQESARDMVDRCARLLAALIAQP